MSRHIPGGMLHLRTAALAIGGLYLWQDLGAWWKAITYGKGLDQRPSYFNSTVFSARARSRRSSSSIAAIDGQARRVAIQTS